MHSSGFILALSLALRALAQSDADSITLTGASDTTRSPTATGADYATSGTTYADQSETVTLSNSNYATATDLSSYLSSILATANGTAVANGTAMANSSTPTNTTATSSPSQTLLVGSSSQTTASNGTGSSTSSSAQPTNTVPCNGYPAFCNRKYSNITYVGAHNSPFIKPGNLASNQALEVETQLNDGVRMLQFQTHLVNDTVYLCHTSCELLNAGTLEDYLRTVANWLRNHPYDVVTILMGNDDVIRPANYTAPVVNSGLINFVYTPPTVPMPIERWPTLAEMIFRQQRAVIMLDYEANQTAIPWLLDEFSQMSETPFSPTDRSFPCTIQRPPKQPPKITQERMYMANHNLNIPVSLAGLSIDIPNSILLNETNAANGFSSAGMAVENCTTMWNRPPNFLLVDFYNIGSFNGSVFQAAAVANGVNYNRDRCCGTNGEAVQGAGSLLERRVMSGYSLAVVVIGLIMLY